MAGYTHKAKTKMAERQQEWLSAYATYHSIERAIEESGVPLSTFERWRSKDRAFAQAYREASKTKQAYLKRTRVEGKDAYGLLYDSQKKYPDKGTFAEWRRRYLGRPVSPHQREMVEAFEDRSNLVMFFLMPPGPQPTSALVQTPDGPRKIGDLIVGDEVFADDGTITTITRVQDAGILETFRLTTRDGSSTVAAGRHRFPAFTNNERKAGRVSASPMVGERLDDIAASLMDDKGRHVWRLPATPPVDQPERRVPVDPYLMGLLLGDGSFRQNTVKITTVDQFIVDEMEKRVPDGCYITHIDIHHRIAGTFRDPRHPGGQRSIMRTILAGLGLGDHYAYEKFVPDVFLNASASQRLNLLRGIMDSDGSPRRDKPEHTSTPLPRDWQKM